MTSPMTGWLCLLMSATMSAPPGDFPEFKTGQYDITFEESSPDTAPAEVVRRLDVDQEPPAYDIATEKFHVWVPNAYAHDREWGLFVWVDAGDAPRIHEDWEKVLAEHKLLAIAAYHSGNRRHTASRMQLAVDAAFNMRRRFNITPRRVYISGVSGGGRVASMVGIAYADVFSGTFPIVGANFYKPIPAPGRGPLSPCVRPRRHDPRPCQGAEPLRVPDRIEGLQPQEYQGRLSTRVRGRRIPARPLPRGPRHGSRPTLARVVRQGARLPRSGRPAAQGQGEEASLTCAAADTDCSEGWKR